MRERPEPAPAPARPPAEAFEAFLADAERWLAALCPSVPPPRHRRGAEAWAGAGAEAGRGPSPHELKGGPDDYGAADEAWEERRQVGPPGAGWWARLGWGAGQTRRSAGR